MAVPRDVRRSSAGGRKRLEEPCLRVEWGAREHPYPQEDSSHGP